MSITNVMNAILTIALVVSYGFNLHLMNSLNVKNIELAYLSTANGLLKDQVIDYGVKLSTTKTYAEGLTDGLVRSQTASYVDGYHTAINQISEEGFSEFSEKIRLTNKTTDELSQEAKPASFENN